MAERISILIITYNRPADLLELLINLGEQTGTNEVLEEILILNNASTEPYDEVVNYVNTHPQLKAQYILSDTNLGVAKGRNKLMEIARGGLFLNIDDDMAFTDPDDLLKLAGLFEEPFFKEANTGVITFRVIYYENKEVQVTAFPHQMYAEVMKKTGPYPTDFHYGMEEYDLAYRILDAGYTIGFDNSVTIAHKESALGRAPNYKKLQMQWINKSKVAWRYLPFKYFITTSVSWAIQYLRMARGHLGTFFASLWQIGKIPFTEKKHTVNKKTLDYLRKVEARLKY